MKLHEDDDEDINDEGDADESSIEVVKAEGGMHTANHDGSPRKAPHNPTAAGVPAGPMNPPVDPNTTKSTEHHRHR